MPASLRRRLQQSIALGRRVNELEKQCAMACDSRDAAMSKVEGLEAQLRRATARASAGTRLIHATTPRFRFRDQLEV